MNEHARFCLCVERNKYWYMKCRHCSAFITEQTRKAYIIKCVCAHARKCLSMCEQGCMICVSVRTHMQGVCRMVHTGGGESLEKVFYIICLSDRPCIHLHLLLTLQ